MTFSDKVPFVNQLKYLKQSYGRVSGATVYRIAQRNLTLVLLRKTCPSP
ncbi:MAG: hypothetical protein ACYT04_42180 [Nostoc sp.]